MKQKFSYLKTFFILCTIIVLIYTWFAGKNKSQDALLPSLYRLLPSENFIIIEQNQIYTVWKDSSFKKFSSFLSTGESEGYGGLLKTAISADSSGTITGVTIISHKETPSFLRRIISNKFLKQFLNKSITDSLKLDHDIDVISGATYSSRALNNSVRIAARKIAAVKNKTEYINKSSSKIEPGYAELILILLLISGIIIRQLKTPKINIIRWISLATGLFFLGFIIKSLLTLSFINKFIIGSPPDIHTNLFLYILSAGILLSLILTNKNPYCGWLCPFGAAQELIGKIGGARPRTSIKVRKILIWVQRVLLVFALAIALLFRNPTLSSYEIFGTFFNLTGSNIQFIFLGIILVISLFILKPWCRFFCPIKPFIDFIKYSVKKVKQLWL